MIPSRSKARLAGAANKEKSSFCFRRLDGCAVFGKGRFPLASALAKLSFTLSFTILLIKPKGIG